MRTYLASVCVLAALFGGVAARADLPLFVWRSWGPDVFRDAKEQNRLVLLNLTASWGPWCKAMETETYAHPAVAEIVNASFIAVRVDRDDRPDLSDRYKRDGWPTVAVLTSTGEPLDGAGYLSPRELAYFLMHVDAAYQAERAKLDAYLDIVSQDRQQFAEAVLVAQPTQELTARAVRDVAALIAVNHDDAHGGFPSSRGAKYPRPDVLEFLLARARAGGDDKEARRMVRTTLSRMAAGGLRDHVGGGFFRFCNDPQWLEPRFEKVLADNAGLLRCYLWGLEVLGEPEYRRVAEEIIGYLDGVLYDPARGLYRMLQESAASGESDDEYHTWTEAELRSLLTADEYRIFAARYGIDEAGDLRGADGISRQGLNVLHHARDIAAAAELCGLKREEAVKRLDAALETLRLAQAKRSPPPVDPRCDMIGNALVVEAYLEAARQLKRDDVRARALDVLATLLQHGYDTVRGAINVLSSSGAGIDHLSIDDVALARALLAAHRASGDDAYGEQARALLATVARRYRVPRGGLTDIAADGPREGLLAARTPDLLATAGYAHALLDLAALGDANARAEAYAALRGEILTYTDAGISAAPYAWAVQRYLGDGETGRAAADEKQSKKNQ